MKRGYAGDYGPAKRSAGPSIPQAAVCVKLLQPDDLTLAVLGPKGSTKKTIEEETRAKILFSNKDDYYPNSRLRVMAMYADDTGPIFHAFQDHILQMTIDAAERERSNGERDPLLLAKEDGKYVVRLLVSKRTSSAVIGPRGANIKEIRKSSGATLTVENEAHMGHQIVRLIGVPDALLLAFQAVVDYGLEEVGTPEAISWAQLINFGDTAQTGNHPLAEESGLVGNVPGAQSKGEPKGARSKGDGKGRKGKSADSGKSADRGKSKGKGDIDDGSRLLHEAIASMPPGTASVQYSITCELPSDRIGALIGRGGGYTQQVEKWTHTQVSFERAPPGEGPDALRQANVIGGLLNMYAAHALLIKKNWEIEQLRAQDDPNPGQRKAQDGPRTESRGTHVNPNTLPLGDSQRLPEPRPAGRVHKESEDPASRAQEMEMRSVLEKLKGELRIAQGRNEEDGNEEPAESAESPKQEEAEEHEEWAGEEWQEDAADPPEAEAENWEGEDEAMNDEPAQADADAWQEAEADGDGNVWEEAEAGAEAEAEAEAPAEAAEAPAGGALESMSQADLAAMVLQMSKQLAQVQTALAKTAAPEAAATKAEPKAAATKVEPKAKAKLQVVLKTGKKG